MTLAVVTGAYGFIGSAVTRRLVQEGFNVRTLARASTARRNLAEIDCETILGDLRDPEAVTRLMRGAEILFHVAADYRLWAPNPNEIRQNNLTTTQNVMNAALAAGVERVVYTSSVAALKPPDTPIPSDETASIREADAVGAYKQSKVAAQDLVERMVREQGLQAVIVNPTAPLGPGDIRPTPTGRVVVEAASGRMPAFVDTGLNLVHVDDVAAGHLAAFRQGRIGERYILGGENISLAQMLADIASLVGRRAPRLSLSPGMVMPVAFAAEAIARITGREPFVSLDALRMSRYKMYYSSTKAENELGYHARPYHEALVEAVAWFRSVGYLR
ncbi:hopanoid-associated sugar epimerase [Methylovirgula sp. 4M-Z18]|uniref:hopanoid-associated sugar epimerase n=1 Tax=Methylovirgula sp. 4M-Z18 TaxID=2293567 RepID=UPI000E2FAE87|nr:hopanoid-associated sugar epimerase [Methylovirgula sp. 4M-Z18]RFB76426.1 NAD-dependent epimerase/dehydratase family protein [Methylovirgula sp. 4M-Z18]